MFGQKLEHLDLIEYVIVDLLKVKWNSFVRRTFYTQFFIFIMFFLLSSCCFIMRETTPVISEECQDSGNETSLSLSNVTSNITNLVQRFKREDFLQVLKLIEDAFNPILNSFQLCKDLINNTESFRSAGTGIPDELSGADDVTRFSDLEMNLNDTMMNGTDICAAEEEALVCFHHTYDTLEKQVRLGMEVALMVWSVLYLVKAGHEYTFLGKRIWMDNMKMCPSRLVLCARLKDNMTLI